MTNQAEWYIPGPGDKNLGPLTSEQLVAQWRSGKVRSDTLCWKKDMAEWQPVSAVEPLASSYKAAGAAQRKKVLGVTCVSLLVLAVLGGGWLAYRIWLGPAGLRDARELFQQKQYAEAGRSLAPLMDNASPAPEVLCWMGAAGLYDALQSSDSAYSRHTANAQIEDAIAMMLRGAAAGEHKQLVDRLLQQAPAACNPEDPAVIARIMAIYEARRELGVAPAADLAAGLVEALQQVPAAVLQRGLGDEVLRFCMECDPSTVAQLLDWLSATVARRGRSGFVAAVDRLERVAADNDVARRMLARATLDRCRTGRDLSPSDMAGGLDKVEMLDPELAGDVRRTRLDVLRRRLDGGAAAEVADALCRAAGDWTGLEHEQAALALATAKALKTQNRDRAMAVLNVALQAEPGLSATEEVAWLALELPENPNEEKLARCQAFLDNFPESERRTEVLRMIVRDAVAVATQRRRRGPQPGPFLEAGRQALEQLMDLPTPPANLDEDVLNLARALVNTAGRDAEAGKKARKEAVALAGKLLEVMPDAPRRLEIAQAVEQWRKATGRGTLAPDFDTLADRVEKELQIMTIASGGAVRALASRPQVIHVAHIARDCKAAKFSSDEAEILKSWVANGGILWCNNDVLSFFGVAYERRAPDGYKPLCRPGVPPEVSPILAGCKKVHLDIWCDWSDCTVNLSSDKHMIPLLSGDNGTYWMLVRYGNGWISDVKRVFTDQYDGARFWLNFRLFCMGEPIPGADVHPSDQDPSRRVYLPPGPLPEPQPAPAPTPAPAPKPPPVSADPNLETAVQLCRHLIDNPQDEDKLQELYDAAAAIEDTNVRCRYLSVCGLACARAGRNDLAVQVKTQITAIDASSQYLTVFDRDRYMMTCDACNGTRRVAKPCAECNSKGEKTCPACHGSGRKKYHFSGDVMKCSKCGGDGKSKCLACRGTGHITRACTACGRTGKVFSRVALESACADALREAAMPASGTP